MRIFVEIILAFSLGSVDSSGLKIVSEDLRSPISDFVFKTLTNSGDGETVLFGSLVYWSFWGDCQESAMRSYVVGLGATSLFVQATKYITNRERPDGRNNRSNSSFPSGHAATAFYIASFYSSLHSEYKVPLYLWAMGVSISRVYLRRHWPSDIIVGAIIGYAGGKLFYKIRERF
ncbi:MAG: phosphatase PAP2 family protein [bacterium]|nr:phosphatase PAP2 family protein [bacterium]